MKIAKTLVTAEYLASVLGFDRDITITSVVYNHDRNILVVYSHSDNHEDVREAVEVPHFGDTVGLGW